jgi:hypothetical protein
VFDGVEFERNSQNVKILIWSVLVMILSDLSAWSGDFAGECWPENSSEKCVWFFWCIENVWMKNESEGRKRKCERKSGLNIHWGNEFGHGLVIIYGYAIEV